MSLLLNMFNRLNIFIIILSLQLLLLKSVMDYKRCNGLFTLGTIEGSVNSCLVVSLACASAGPAAPAP